MQMLLTGVLLGFITGYAIADDIAERKINAYLEEKNEIRKKSNK